MELKELRIKRQEIINAFKKEKEALRIKLQTDLAEIDQKIKGKQKSFSNIQASTVKQVMSEVTKGTKVTKPDTYKWNKAMVQKIKDKK